VSCAASAPGTGLVMEGNPAHGHRRATNSPKDRRALISPPALEEAIRLKTDYALRPLVTMDACLAGMLWYPNRPEYEQARQSVGIRLGWDRNMRLGMCFWRWGRRIGDAGLCRRGERCAEVWCRRRSRRSRRISSCRLITSSVRAGGTPTAPKMATRVQRRKRSLNFADFCQRERAVGTPRLDWGTRTVCRPGVLFQAPSGSTVTAFSRLGGTVAVRLSRVRRLRPVLLIVAALAKAALLPAERIGWNVRVRFGCAMQMRS